MATILTLALVIWAFTYKPRKKRSRIVKFRRALPVTTPPILSPAEIARRDKERERAAREAEKERIKAEKERQKREQAEKDYSFYSARLEELYRMETDTAKSYWDAVETVEHDATQNKYSYVVSEKKVRQHIANRDKLQNSLLKLQNQIHAAEKNLNKAKQITDNA